MPNELVRRMLRSKGVPFTDEDIKLLSDAQGSASKGGSYGTSRHKPRLPEICFTGFKMHEKLDYEALAVLVNIKPVRSVTKNLTYLCTGPNAGPVKIQKAKEGNVEIITLTEFTKIATSRGSK